jgi:hypothetical protein
MIARTKRAEDFIRTGVRRLVETPHYALGRFQIARAVHASVCRTRQALLNDRPELVISDNYKDELTPVRAGCSGLVESSIDADRHVDGLARRAFSTGLQLTEPAVAALRAAAQRLPLEENGRALPSFAELTASRHLREQIAIATVGSSSKLPEIGALAGDPMITEVIARYLGYTPSRASSWLFWSFQNAISDERREAAYQTIRFHYDVHGFNFLYVNFYLLDTDARSGAHVLIEGSHRDKRLRHLLGSAKLDDERAVLCYGRERIKVMEGRAGSGFFEDAACYHKALPPLERDRLMLQLRYQ